MSEICRVGIIGTGGIARAHTAGYNACERTEIVAVADISEEQLSKYKDEFKVQNLYTDYMEMLQKENLDIVSVCTWHLTHRDIVVNAAPHTKGIICEKPMALSLGDADDMIAACDAAGTKLAIGHQRRFAAQHLKAREILRNGAIGELRFAWISSPPPLLGWGTHVADLARYYLGEVEFVMGQIDFSSRRESPRHGEYTEDMSSAYLKFTSGLRALFETESGQHRLHIFGEEGEIEVMVDGDLRVKAKGSAEWVKPALQRENSFKLEMDELVAAIEEDREHLSNGKEGRAALEILMAVFESSRRHKTVVLPLAEKGNPLQMMVEGEEI